MRPALADLAVVGGRVGVELPADDCRWLGRVLAEAIERTRRDHVPIDRRVLRVLDLLNAAAEADGVSLERNPSEDLGPDLAEWLSTYEAAITLDLTPRRVQQLATAGEFAGAEQCGRTWMIPAVAVAVLAARRTAARV